MSAGNLAEALTQFEEVLQRSPTNALARSRAEQLREQLKGIKTSN